MDHDYDHRRPEREIFIGLVWNQCVGRERVLIMYRKILVALENSRDDETLLPHVSELATLHHSELLLVHVADGYVARNYNQLNLAESQEMKEDRAYL